MNKSIIRSHGQTYNNPELEHHEWYPEVKGYFDEFFAKTFKERCKVMKDPEYRRKFIKKIKWCNNWENCPLGSAACPYAHTEAEFRLPFCAFDDLCTKKDCDFYHTGDCPDIEIPAKPVPVVVHQQTLEERFNQTVSKKQPKEIECTMDELICLANKFNVTLSVNK